MESIGINPQLLVAFLINFLILFGLLTAVLYKPILKMLDERQAKIKESLEQAEKIKEQTSRSEEQIKAAIEAARKEGQVIIAQASQIADKIKEEAKEGARKEADIIINKAKDEIKLERDKSIADLRTEFANLTVLAAEKVIKESVDAKKHRKLIDDVLEESKTFKQN
ncbi:MAG: F0F1 ATP synthase subunit B [Dehalococcoidia bacterium]|jgi:F-type H+-transporting ATPase subunit b|nr:F0F1 ATP synthase subunit B [Dehalococcoidia bacterium]MDD5495130.1 F0F1 ATP synthase subunit B [Dehalococcoidia bacterium]